MLTVLLFTLLQAAPANIPANLAAELKSIKTELAAIEAEGTALDTEASALKTKSARIEDAEAMLERGITTLTSGRASLQAEIDRHQTDAAQQNAVATALARDVKSYNARCDRSFDREKEIAQFNACVAEEAALRVRIADSDAWAVRVTASKDRLLTKGGALQTQQDLLDQINASVLSDQLDVANRADALGKNRQKLDDRIHALDARRTKTLAALANVNAVSQDCVEIAKKITKESCEGKGDPSDPANWNTPCEQAARCLQKAFDGAR